MKKLLSLILTLVTSISFLSTPVMAASVPDTFGVETAILKTCGDKEGSDGITCVLNLVVDIMTIGIGILGVIGITVVGIQYLTAGGSEEKTRKAKRRMFEIIIGLVAYVLLYAFLRWLLPSFGETTSYTTIQETLARSLLI